MVTIKDVAKEAGVAISTVSNVLNHADVVSDETKRKVMEAVERLNYIPNMNARLLKANKKNMIGLFIENLTGGFYNMLIQEIQKECRKRGYVLNIYVCNENESQEVYSIITSSGVGAAIILNTLTDDSYVERLRRTNLPTVFLDREVSGVNISSRLLPNYDGAAMGMEYLIQKGKRRIGYIHGVDNNYDNIRRYRAYLDVMRKYQLEPYRPFIIRGNFEQEETYEAIKRVLSEGVEIPDAIFCANDEIGFGCIKALRENGIRVPRDISILGFDDIDMSQYYIPPLTTIHSPIAELGTESAREAIRLAEGDQLEGNQKILTATLTERESVL